MDESCNDTHLAAGLQLQVWKIGQKVYRSSNDQVNTNIVDNEKQKWYKSIVKGLAIIVKNIPNIKKLLSLFRDIISTTSIREAT